MCANVIDKKIKDGSIEETLLHENAHINLNDLNQSEEWKCARAFQIWKTPSYEVHISFIHL